MGCLAEEDGRLKLILKWSYRDTNVLFIEHWQFNDVIIQHFVKFFTVLSSIKSYNTVNTVNRTEVNKEK